MEQRKQPRWERRCRERLQRREQVGRFLGSVGMAGAGGWLNLDGEISPESLAEWVRISGAETPWEFFAGMLDDTSGAMLLALMDRAAKVYADRLPADGAKAVRQRWAGFRKMAMAQGGIISPAWQVVPVAQAEGGK